MQTNFYFLSLEKTKILKEIGLDFATVCKEYGWFWNEIDGNLIASNHRLDELDDGKYVPALNSEQLREFLPLDIYTKECGKCSLNFGSDIINDVEEQIVSYDECKGSCYPYVTFSAEHLVDAMFDAIEYCHKNGFLQPDSYVDKEMLDNQTIQNDKEMSNNVEKSEFKCFESKFCIIYHKEDNDGLFSMALIFNYLTDELHIDKNDIRLIGADYQDMKKLDIDELCQKNERIIMTDISFNEFSKIKEIYKKKRSKFWWFDHHAPIIKQSLLEKCEDINGIRDTSRSAIMNVYNYLYDPFNEKYNSKSPDIELLRILSAWDSFSFLREGYDIDYVRNVNVGVSNDFMLDRDRIIKFVRELLKMNADAQKDIIMDFYDSGKSFNKVIESKDAKLIEDFGQVYSLEENGEPVMVLYMQGGSNSLMFKSVSDKYKHGAVIKHLKDGNFSIHLYNTDTKYDLEMDCGAYLKSKYGGGGHKGAAGAQITEDVFLKIMRTKKI